MRKLATLLLAGLLLALVAAPASARVRGEHPWCNGIDQAMSKASAKGKEISAVVAEKFACGPVVPDPVDTVACPEGQMSIARWTYVGSQTGPVEHGYPTWVGGWTLTSGAGAGPVLNARPDGGASTGKSRWRAPSDRSCCRAPPARSSP